jgi:hypothetical protein
MSHYPRLLSALAVCVLPLTACSSEAAQEASHSSRTAPTAEVSPSSAPTPQVPGDGTFPQVQYVDRTDVEATARTAAILLHSWDTATDRTETAAAIRASPLFSGQWAAAQVEPARNSSQADWLGPSQHRAYSRAQAVPSIGDLSHEVGEGRVARAYTVSWRWASRDGHPALGTGSRQVVLYLEQHGGVWEVVGHRFSDMGTTGTGGHS